MKTIAPLIATDLTATPVSDIAGQIKPGSGNR